MVEIDVTYGAMQVRVVADTLETTEALFHRQWIRVTEYYKSDRSYWADKVITPEQLLEASQQVPAKKTSVEPYHG